MKNCLALLFLLTTLQLASAACADWTFDFDAGFMRDDNITRAQLPNDIKGDNAATMALSGGFVAHVADNTDLSIAADLQQQLFARFSGLSNTQVGVTVGTKTKFGLGALAPVLRFSASAAQLDYHDDLRDGWRYTAGAGVGKRLSNQWDIRGDYLFERRTADQTNPQIAGRPGDVFDNRGRTLSVRTAYLATEAVVFSFGYARRDGDIVSSTARNPRIFGATSALATDRTFGSNVIAYKLGAVTHTLDIGLSYALGQRSSVNIAATRALSYADRDLSYYGNVFNASYMFNF